MPIVPPVIRNSFVALLGLAAVSTTATAQPQARCPGADAGMECPEPQQPTAEGTTPDTTDTTTETTTETTTDTTTTVAPEPATPAEPTTALEPMPQRAPTYQPADIEPMPEDEPFYDRYGLAISLGGGVAGFTNEAMRDTTDDGGAWGVRAAMGLNSYIGGEAEYMGSAQSIDALGLDDDAVLVGNGLEAKLRVNVLPEFVVQPFVFGGLAWRHYELSSEGINTSDVESDDDVLEIPVGIGIAWTYQGLMLDARGELRYSEYEDMVPEIGETDGADMHRYGVTANVGYAF